MITTRLAGALIAGSLVIGFGFGAAGTIVARDTSSTSSVAVCADQMADMTSMMNDQNGMMNGQNGMGPAGSEIPDSMQQHHVTPSSAPTQ